jgi:death-on-curing protein
MISISEALEIHKILINTFGGSHGVRDLNGLRSALARPFQTFDNKELYPRPIDKTACLLESILSNHPFIDGNKRTGYVLARLYLINNGIDIHASEADKYEFIIDIASRKIIFEQIVKWLEDHVK